MAIINAAKGIIQSADNSGLLELQGQGVTGAFVNSGGMYVKSVTTAQRTALTPINGMMVYDTTANSLYVYVNSNWAPTASNTVTFNQRALFGYGYTTTAVSVTNSVSSSGVVATDTTGVGSARFHLAACGYGGDKAIFGFGVDGSFNSVSVTNLVSNSGVVATDTTGVGTARYTLAACGYGLTKGIFGYGSQNQPAALSITNLVSDAGVVANDTTGVGTARFELAAATYGLDKGIFGYGKFGSGQGTPVAITNLVSNVGVVATDTAGVGSARAALAAASYGVDKAIFGYGSGPTSITNLVSNLGVVATDTTGVGTARSVLAASNYGNDKAIFGYGYNAGGQNVSMTNLVSNTGVVATDTAGVGTARRSLAATSFGS